MRYRNIDIEVEAEVDRCYRFLSPNGYPRRRSCLLAVREYIDIYDDERRVF